MLSRMDAPAGPPLAHPKKNQIEPSRQNGSRSSATGVEKRQTNPTPPEWQPLWVFSSGKTRRTKPALQPMVGCAEPFIAQPGERTQDLLPMVGWPILVHRKSDKTKTGPQ